MVSIHAPAWGATRLAPDAFRLVAGFNPRTGVGCDADGIKALVEDVQFQSTHPRGVRLATLPLITPDFPGFNPRTRVGCDARVRSTS